MSLEKKSCISIGFGEASKKDLPMRTQKTNLRYLEGDKSKICNEHVCCCLLVCEKHRRILLRKYPHNQIFLPYSTFSDDQSWECASKNFLELILQKLDSMRFLRQIRPPELFDYLGIEMPRDKKLLQRITMFSIYTPETESEKIANMNRIKTNKGNTKPGGSNAMENISVNSSTTTSEAKSGFSDDPAVVEGRKDVNKKLKKETKNTGACLCEHNTESYAWRSLRTLVRKYSDRLWGPEPALFLKTLIETIRNNPENLSSMKTHASVSVMSCFSLPKGSMRIQTLIEQAKYRKKIIKRLYNEYIVHCYPSRFMTLLSFRTFMLKFEGWSMMSKVSMERFFKAIDYTETNYLTFEEILIGFAAMDTITPHSGTTLELRLMYIFRMYCDPKGRLNLSHFQKLCYDILLPMNNDKEVYLQMGNILKHLADRAFPLPTSHLGVEEFLRICLDSKEMIEMTTPIYRAPSSLLIPITTLFDYNVRSPNLRKEKFFTQLVQKLPNHYRECCFYCKFVDFQIATDLKVIMLNNAVPPIVPVEVGDLKVTFAVSTVDISAQEMMNKIRKTAEAYNDFWYFGDKNNQSDSIKRILYRAKEVYNDFKIRSVNAPVWVVPGVQGSLKDFFIIEKLLTRIPTASVLFLGNHLGPDAKQSLQIFLLMICLKLQQKDRFIMIRGMNETKDFITKNNYEEQTVQLGLDPDIWRLVADICSQLPVAATIDDRILCSAGGIPRSRKSIEWYRNYFHTNEKTSDAYVKEFIQDIWEPVDKSDDRSTRSKVLYGRTVSSAIFEYFRHQNHIKLVFVTHSVRKLKTTIRMEFRSRMFSLGISDQDSKSSRRIAAAFIGYNKVRLFEFHLLHRK